MSDYEPLFCKPLLVERVWGGNRLERLHGKAIKPGTTIGESWELCDRPEAQSVISNGRHQGRTLRQVFEADPAGMLGPALREAKRFPLLLKYIDAGQPLSVQVHPNDEGARAYNDRGKSECWTVVHVEPGSRIIRGLKPGTTRADYQRAVSEDRVADVLHEFEPRVGDVLALPAGMVHAIGAGIVVAEIQQNSDLTFRIYDYKRVGLDGKPRQLHITEALEAIRFDEQFDTFEGDMRRDTVQPLKREQNGEVTAELVLKGKYFDLQRLSVRPGASWIAQRDTAAASVLMAIGGAGEINGLPLKTGDTVLLPAALARVEVRSTGASDLTVLLSTPTRP